MAPPTLRSPPHARRLLRLLLLCAGSLAFAAEAPAPLEDPIERKIPMGDVAVAATQFVRFPRTADTASPATTNEAHARLQYMKPVPDGSGRLAVSDVRGLLYLTDESGRPPTLFLDLRREDVSFFPDAFPNESGLLGFAFHPDFGNAGTPGHGKLYTAFSVGPDSGTADYLDYQGEQQESVIREWTVTDTGADSFAGTSREVFRIGQFAPTHNIGTIAFNPSARPGSADHGLLYACLGDGGGANDPEANGQSLVTPMAAIIRIDPLGGDGRYGVPPDNPFVGEPGAAPEIWAWGLRHPQHFSWDVDGRLFINDIGQDMVEEVNLGVAGGNYGWRLREGTFATAYGRGTTRLGAVYRRPEQDDASFIYPVAEYDHDEGYAIGSGFVYRGEAISALHGRYVFADVATGRLFHFATNRLTPGEPAPLEELRLVFDGQEKPLLDVAGFENTYHGGLRADLRLGIDSAGELYLLTKGDGWVRKLTAL